MARSRTPQRSLMPRPGHREGASFPSWCWDLGVGCVSASIASNSNYPKTQWLKAAEICTQPGCLAELGGALLLGSILLLLGPAG